MPQGAGNKTRRDLSILVSETLQRGNKSGRVDSPTFPLAPILQQTASSHAPTNR